MKAENRVLLMVAAVLLFSFIAWSQDSQANCSSCATVEQALSDAQHIRVGVTRSDVEKYFTADGMAFRDHTVYTYRKCRFIKLTVDFVADPAVKNDFSPRDTVSKISQLYLDYPVND